MDTEARSLTKAGSVERGLDVVAVVDVVVVIVVVVDVVDDDNNDDGAMTLPGLRNA